MPSAFDDWLEKNGEPRYGGGVPMPMPQQQQPQAAPTSVFDSWADQQGLGQSASGPSGDGGGGFSMVNAAFNLPGDVYQLGKETVNTFAHPITTAQNLYQAGPSGIWNALKDQYGSWEKFSKYAEEHPAHLLFDLSFAATGVGAGAGLAAKGVTTAGGISSKVAKAGEIASKVGTYTDPLLLTAKAGGKIYKAANTITRKGLGYSTATHEAPTRAMEAGREAGLGDKTNSKLFTEHLRNRGSKPDELYLRTEAGLKEAKDEAQGRINKLYAPLEADKTPLASFDREMKAALQDAKDTAYHSAGEPANETAVKVYKELEDTLNRWIMPDALLRSAARERAAPAGYWRTGYRPELASKYFNSEEITKLGGDPTKTTSLELVRLMADKRRSFKSLDSLKQQLSTDLYEGYKYGLKGPPNPKAAEVASKAVNRLRDVIKNETAPRHGAAYEEGQKIWSSHKAEVGDFLKTFGLSRDTISRRLGSINRDGSFADFSARLKQLTDLQKRAPSLRGVEYISAGKMLHPGQPRNMVQGLATAGGLMYFAQPLAAATAIALHIPRLAGEASHAIGKLEGWILRPVRKVAQAVNAVSKRTGVPITPHGTALAAGATGRTAAIGEKKQQLKTALIEAAKKRGHNIHPRVLEKLANNLMSEDVNEFMAGIKNISSHKRLMALIESIGNQ